MTNVDVSPYATLGKAAQPNLLGPLAQVVGIQNASNQNALFQQEFGARKAMGEVAQQSVDPDTGQVDWNKFATIGSQRPDLAFKMPELLNNVAQRKLMDAQTLKTNLENASAKQQAIGAAALTAAKQHGQNVKTADLVPFVADLQGQGFLTPQEGISYLSTLGHDKAGPDLYNHLIALAGQSQRGSQLIDGVAGSYKDDAFHDDNGNPVPGFVSPIMGGATPSGGGSTQSAGPAQSAAPPQAGLQGTPAPSPAPQQAPPPQGAPDDQGSQGAPQQQQAPQRNLTPGPTGPYQGAALKEASDYGKDVNERTNAANQLLLTMQQSQRYLKNFTTGGGEAMRADLGQLADALGMPQATKDAIVGGDLSSVQAARKTLFGIGSQIAAQLIHAGGGRMTQTEWGKTLSEGAPNIDLTPDAVGKIMTSMKELAHVTNMESDHFRGRQDQASHGFYNMANVQNDWAKTFGAYLNAREGK